MNSYFVVGTHVICRGAFAREFSICGVVELVIPENPTGAHAYGVRLENGNYKVFAAEDVTRDLDSAAARMAREIAIRESAPDRVRRATRRRDGR